MELKELTEALRVWPLFPPQLMPIEVLQATRMSAASMLDNKAAFHLILSSTMQVKFARNKQAVSLTEGLFGENQGLYGVVLICAQVSLRKYVSKAAVTTLEFGESWNELSDEEIDVSCLPRFPMGERLEEPMRVKDDRNTLSVIPRKGAVVAIDVTPALSRMWLSGNQLDTMVPDMEIVVELLTKPRLMSPPALIAVLVRSVPITSDSLLSMLSLSNEQVSKSSQYLSLFFRIPSNTSRKTSSPIRKRRVGSASALARLKRQRHLEQTNNTSETSKTPKEYDNPLPEPRLLFPVSTSPQDGPWTIHWPKDDLLEPPEPTKSEFPDVLMPENLPDALRTIDPETVWYWLRRRALFIMQHGEGIDEKYHLKEQGFVAVAQTTRSLRCTLSLRIMETAVRGFDCDQHDGAVDALAWLSQFDVSFMNSSSKPISLVAPIPWMCPVCLQPLTFENLVIDHTLQEALRFRSKLTEVSFAPEELRHLGSPSDTITVENSCNWRFV